MSDNKTNQFQHLVLAALWILILRAFGKDAHLQATNFQSSAIAFGDAYGLHTKGAEKYRREVTYGERL